jgi:hypothetical protein
MGSVAAPAERRQKLGKIEAARHKVRDILKTRARHRIVPIHNEDGRAVLSRFIGALFRAFLVVLLFAIPSVLLPGMGTDGKQMVALVALFAGVLTFIEYNAEFPGLIEFRDAAPYNRVRFLMLFGIVAVLSISVANAHSPGNFGSLVEAVAFLCGLALDFPYSPVRLVMLMLSDDATPEQMIAMRSAAGVAYMICVISLVFFVVLLRLADWPLRHRAFNVWINLPTFDPTAGADVVDRLDRDARVNLALGILLPFVMPAVVKFGGMGLGALDMAAPQTMVWVIAAWAFLPASLVMRGIAMGRVASMIRDRRRRGADPVAGERAYAPA